MKKLMSLIILLLGTIALSSCSSEKIYSLKEAGGFEVSDIVDASASQSTWQSYIWPLCTNAYSYLDCEYIKADFDICKEFLSDELSSKKKDDAYVIHFNVENADMYKDFGPIFYISHNTNYMYFDGIDSTYRSKQKMPSKFIELLELHPIVPTGTFKLNIIDDNNFIYDKDRIIQISYFAPGNVIKLHSYPIMDADLVMYVDGEFYSKQTSIETDDGYIWEYTFTMPIKDSTIEFKAVGGM